MRTFLGSLSRAASSLAAAALLCCAFGPAAAQQLVDLELLLAIDTSSSINDEEYRLQIDGLAAAFRDPAVAAAIEAGGNRGIAVAVVQWAEGPGQSLVVPWTRVRNRAEAILLARRIAATPRAIAGGATAISYALEFAAAEIDNNGFDGLRKVIDLSGDGRANHGPVPTVGRDRALAKGITVNALAILNEIPLLDRYFLKHVIGGGDAFVMVAKDWMDFAEAIREKLVREISLLPLASLTGKARQREAGWLGDLDSNQDCSGQSRVFYR